MATSADVEIWNEGKELLISNFEQEADTVDIFSLRPVKPKNFLIHRIVLGLNTTTTSPVFSYQDIYNKGYEIFISNMSLSFKTSPIVGIGSVSYCDYFGYSAIERVTIKVGDAEFMIEGDYFFNEIMSMDQKRIESIMNDAGHNDFCRRLITSNDSYEEVKSSENIKVLLPLPFGKNFPKNLLPVAVNDKIRIEVIMRHMSDLINTSKGSNFETGSFSDYSLTIELYTRKTSPRGLYEPRIDVPIKSIHKSNVFKINNCRYLSINQKCTLDNEFYPAFIANWKTENDVVDQFIDYLMDNLIYVIHMDKVEEFKASFPKTAILSEVKNGEVIVGKNEAFNQKRIVTISIRDIPVNHFVFYHTNLLVINKKLADNGDIVNLDNPWFDSFNISEKIISVIAIYDSICKKVIPIKVKHIITSQHASLPIKIFETYGEDNRMLNSISYKMRVYYSNGSNIFDPKNLNSFSIYNGEQKSNYLVYNGFSEETLYKLQNYSPYITYVLFSHPQNDSRFHFKNINSDKFFEIVVDEKKFKVHKSELLKEFKPNKEFREPRHKEEGFSSLFRKHYEVTYYQSQQISQSLTSGDKITTSLIIV